MRSRAYRRLNLLVDDMAGCAITLVIALIASVFILYIGKFVWLTYMQTPIGQEILKHYGDRAQAVSAVFGRSLVAFAIEITILILKTGLIVGTVAQVLFLTSVLYSGRGLAMKLFVWTIPFGGLIAVMIERIYGLEHSEAFIIAFIPSAMILDCCLKLASRVFPDGLIINAVYRVLEEFQRLVRSLFRTEE